VLEVLFKTLVSLGLLAVGAAYAGGWRRLRAAGYAAPRWRFALYVLGLATIGAALLSPLDALAAERFSAHMGQHLLLTMVAAPLLVLGNPLPLVLWGVPAGARRALGTTLRRGAPLRTGLSALTLLPVAGILHVTTVWVWHLPFMYDAAAEHELVHAVEHRLRQILVIRQNFRCVHFSRNRIHEREIGECPPDIHAQCKPRALRRGLSARFHIIARAAIPPALHHAANRNL